jgi:hypothetical protein
LAGRKTFVAGEILTAADVNAFLMDQAVQVYDDATARGSAIPSPLEGQVTYRKDTKQVEAFNGTAFAPIGRILQVVSTTKTDTFSMTSETFATVTGLSVSITPISASSKVLVFVSMSAAPDGGTGMHGRLLRGSTPIAVGDADGSRIQVTFTPFTGNNDHYASSNMNFLDTPNTTGSTTYSVQVRRTTGSGVAYVNRSVADSNNTVGSRAVSTITVMEVAG